MLSAITKTGSLLKTLGRDYIFGNGTPATNPNVISKPYIDYSTQMKTPISTEEISSQNTYDPPDKVNESPNFDGGCGNPEKFEKTSSNCSCHDVLKKISLDKDFTRFLNDPTFHYKVTVCIGEERILCSGVLLAQQSSVLEQKFREDCGVLIFEEMIGVCNSDKVLHECVRFMHGASISITPTNIEVILKFGSWYKVKALTETALNWILNKHLCNGVSVINVLHYIKLSNCLHSEECTKLKQNVFSFLENECHDISFKLVQESYSGYLLNINGFDIARIAGTKPFARSTLFPDWVALSVENKSFVLEYAYLFDFKNIFDSADTFSAFVDLFSWEESLMHNASAIKSILEIQRSFLSGSSKVTMKESETTFLTNDIANTRGSGSCTDLEAVPVAKLSPNNSKTNPGLSKAKSCTKSSNSAKLSLNIKAKANPALSKAESCNKSRNSECDKSDNLERYSKSSVWIGNVPKCVTEIEMKMVFERFGMIDQVVIKHSRHPAFDYAFIYFDYVTSARRLLSQSRYETFELYGVKLKIAEPYD